jgi:hypothetical protein
MKSVHELSAEELQELRRRFYHQHLDDGSLEEIVGEDLCDEEDLDMSLIIDYYEGTYFVEEDFFCNITDDEEPLFMCNCCHDHFPREEMDFDVDDDQDLCKNCNYQTYNEAPYGQD